MSEFYPTKTEKTVISVRIPIDTLKRIDEISANIDISRNEYILQCIDFATKNYGKDKKMNGKE
jgi:metal-responsive CopG/Arc/MetJ family transcriptional regulator